MRAAAAADPAAGHKLDRGLVRAAGAVEDAGGDPADLQVVEAKKRELSDVRKGSAVDEGADTVSPCYVSPLIIEVVRQIVERGARVGVHSWASESVDGNDIGIAEAFYWFTLEAAPPEDVHWMTEAEMARYAVYTVLR